MSTRKQAIGQKKSAARPKRVKTTPLELNKEEIEALQDIEILLENEKLNPVDAERATYREIENQELIEELEDELDEAHIRIDDEEQHHSQEIAKLNQEISELRGEGCTQISDLVYSMHSKIINMNELVGEVGEKISIANNRILIIGAVLAFVVGLQISTLFLK